MKKKIDYNAFVRENLADADVSYRGGTIKINAGELFPSASNPVVGAYQNYLGGGIAGAIVGAAMFTLDELTAKERKHLEPVLEAAKQLFHEINNGGGAEYMQENHGSYEFNQRLPESAY